MKRDVTHTWYSGHTNKHLVIELEIFLRSSKSVCIDKVGDPMQAVHCVYLWYALC